MTWDLVRVEYFATGLDLGLRPGFLPRPEMPLDAILKLRDQIRRTRLSVDRGREITELEHDADDLWCGRRA
jgi:NADH:ubiquinone oxidoreductase subunit B-like Fe-S oxidoreductase